MLDASSPGHFEALEYLQNEFLKNLSSFLIVFDLKFDILVATSSELKVEVVMTFSSL